jgi:transcriptional regulator with XRE-family HTH domain
MVSRLKIERVKINKSQLDLWLATGVPQWRLSLIERGVPPTPEERRKIAEALELTEDELFSSDGVRRVE